MQSCTLQPSHVVGAHLEVQGLCFVAQCIQLGRRVAWEASGQQRSTFHTNVRVFQKCTCILASTRVLMLWHFDRHIFLCACGMLAFMEARMRGPGIQSCMHVPAAATRRVLVACALHRLRELRRHIAETMREQRNRKFDVDTYYSTMAGGGYF